MGWDTEIRDDAGNVVGSLWTGHRDRSYVLPDGGRCPMPQRPAWCRACRAYVAAEEVPALARIDENLEALRAGPEAFRRKLLAEGEHLLGSLDGERLEQFAQWQSEYWTAVRGWRLLRRSPPRCLECFCVEVDLLPEDATEAIHPVTGQRLHVRCVSHSVMVRHWFYSVEGMPLEASREDSGQ